MRRTQEDGISSDATRRSYSALHLPALPIAHIKIAPDSLPLNSLLSLLSLNSAYEHLAIAKGGRDNAGLRGANMTESEKGDISSPPPLPSKHRNRWWGVVGALGTVLLLALFVLPMASRSARSLSIRKACQDCLQQHGFEFRDYCSPTIDHYPRDLSGLSNITFQNLLICPDCFDKQSNTSVGSLSNCDEWATYIYVTCLTNGLPWNLPKEVPVMICPPMFHGNRGGNILWADHSVKWLPDPALVDRLIENPLCMCSNIPPELRSNIYVHVSKRLEKLSNGKYRSHAVGN